MSRVVYGAAVVLLMVPSLAIAQPNQADTDRRVSGGVLVPGWTGRTDKSEMKLSDAKLETMGSGMHITTGPHAIWWNPANTASGNYTVKATMSKTRATPHAESYGIFIGGTRLTEGDQDYLYCVVFGDGSFSAVRRMGSETMAAVSRRVNSAVAKAAANGSARDEIAMTVSRDRVSCSINGTEVWSAAKSQLSVAGRAASTEGIFGLRASHNLSIHVSDFGVIKQ